MDGMPYRTTPRKREENSMKLNSFVHFLSVPVIVSTEVTYDCTSNLNMTGFRLEAQS